MTTPQLIMRTLTFNFAPSITGGIPNVMEVAIIPLADASSPDAGATYASGVQATSVELDSPVNTVSFSLVPTNSPSLTTPINYRAVWRAGVNSRTYTQDFEMPDQDLTWDQLTGNVANLIQGYAYLQPSDLGVPGGVARLDSSGNVVTSDGLVCATTAQLQDVSEEVTQEALTRAAQVVSLEQQLTAQVAAQASAAVTTANLYVTQQSGEWQAQLQSETASRKNEDTALSQQIETNASTVASEITSLTAQISSTQAVLYNKANLASGNVPLTELPLWALQTSVTTVTDEAEMLRLIFPDVVIGSIAKSPAGIFVLTGNSPDNPADWVSISPVVSVNGYGGAVALTAADIQAVPVGGSILSSQVEGLSTSLGEKVDQTQFNDLQNEVTTFQSSPTLVKLDSTGHIPIAELPDSAVVVNSSGVLVNGTGDSVLPSGQVLSVNGLTGEVVLNANAVGALPVNGPVPISVVTGLSADLAAKADLVSGTVPMDELDVVAVSNALTSKADLVGGTIPLSEVPVLPQSQVNGLAPIVSGNSLSPTSNVVNRVNSLETAVSSNSITISSLQGSVTDLPYTTDLQSYPLITDGKISSSVIPDISTSQVTGLQAALSDATTLSLGTVPLSVLPTNIPESYIQSSTGAGTLVNDLALRATLVDGVIPIAQIPLSAQVNPQVVATQADMLALTNVATGNVVVVTGGDGAGTYILTGSSATVLADWIQLPLSGVTSVNGDTGVITLSASDIPGIATSAQLSALQDTVTNNQTTVEQTYAPLSSVANTVQTSELQPTIDSSISQFGQVKHADYVLTVNSSITGIPAIPNFPAGSAVQPGAVVLLTAQALTTQNGLWVINKTGTWTRPADYSTGGYLPGDAMVFVSAYTNDTSPDPTYNDTAWWFSNPTPSTVNSLTVDSGTPNYVQVGWLQQPAVPTSSSDSGIVIANANTTSPSFSLGLNTTSPTNPNTSAPVGAAGGSGLSTQNGGLQVNWGSMAGGVAIKYQDYVPTVASGTTSAVVTHNLNNLYPTVTIWDTATNSLVLAGVTATSANEITIDFSTEAAPVDGTEYMVMVVG